MVESKDAGDDRANDPQQNRIGMRSFSMAAALSLVRERQLTQSREQEDQQRAKDEEQKLRARAKRKRRRQNQKIAKIKTREASEVAERPPNYESEDGSLSPEADQPVDRPAMSRMADVSPEISISVRSVTRGQKKSSDNEGEIEGGEQIKDDGGAQTVSGCTIDKVESSNRQVKKRKRKSKTHNSDLKRIAGETSEGVPELVKAKLFTLVPRAVMLKMKDAKQEHGSIMLASKKYED